MSVSCSRSAHARSRLSRRAPSLAAVLGLAFLCAVNPVRASAAEGKELAQTAALGVGSVIATVVYAPLKVAYAVVGSVVGGGAYLVSGFNAETAQAVISPAIRGNYVVTPDHLRQADTLEFVGRDADVERASVMVDVGDALPAVSAAPPAECAALESVPGIYFATGQADLDSYARAELDRAARSLRSCPWASAHIQAFADASGATDSNLELSLRRGEAVRTYLLSHGIESDRIALQGYGEARPASDNKSVEGRARNRRVEVTLR